jgi:hypothetical protein
MTTKELAKRQCRRWLAVLALASLSASAGACSRAHLGGDYGKSYTAWFVMQHVRTEPADSEPTKRALTSLDSQEASAISKNYRRTVGGSEGQAPGGGMVMISQAHGGSEAYVPPPSGPGGQ